MKPELTAQQLELAMKYLSDPTMDLPQQLKDLSQVEMLGVQVLLESLEQERNLAPYLH